MAHTGPPLIGRKAGAMLHLCGVATPRHARLPPLARGRSLRQYEVDDARPRIDHVYLRSGEDYDGVVEFSATYVDEALFTGRAAGR